MSANDAALGFLVGYNFPTGIRPTSKNKPDDAATLKARIEATTFEQFSESAQHDALLCCINELINELAATAAGKPISKRHSDPYEGSAARTEDFMDTADSNLRRASKGRLAFSAESLANIKSVGTDIRRTTQAIWFKPKVVRVKLAPPKD